MCWKWWNVGAICLFSSQMIWHIFPKRMSLINRREVYFSLLILLFFPLLLLILVFFSLEFQYLIYCFRLTYFDWVYFYRAMPLLPIFFLSFLFYCFCAYNIIVLKLIWCMRLTRLGVKIPKSNVLLLNLKILGPLCI